MSFLTTLVGISEIILIIGLLVMTLLMFGVVILDLIKIVRNRKYELKRKEEK
ncbi:hypothetical protein [Lactobacillus helveticus]|uniref:hypothetical protein n=1 Tax=Lactobacillus helveticus TaxID=1587 RepID=UPI000AFD4FF0|nr:hypothetical protein [Lactobacillus helveticus]